MLVPGRSQWYGVPSALMLPGRRRCCVAQVCLDDARRCVSWLSQGLRWAYGQTSPPQGRLDRAVNKPWLSLSDCTSSQNSDIFCRYLLSSSQHPLIPRLLIGMGTAKASKASRQHPSHDTSTPTWAAGEDNICHRATLLPPIPSLLWAPAL